MVEFNSVAAAGSTAVERLEEMLTAANFAFLVMTGEDAVGEDKLRARQNVIHEAGLFQGRLGFKRAIVLLEDGCESFANIAGLVHIPFHKGHIRGAFEDIRQTLQRAGMLPKAAAS